MADCPQLAPRSVQAPPGGVRRRLLVIVLFLLAGAATPGASAGFIEFLNDRDGWINAVGPFTTIHFNEVPKHTFITDEYADLGVIFTDGDDQITFGESFLNDDWGLDGNGDINVVFDMPQLWIAVDFPGGMQFQLFREGALVYDSTAWVPGGAGNFLGIVSSEFFDAARIIDPLGEAEIDDLHFGVPGPSGLGLLMLGVVTTRRRRPARSSSPFARRSRAAT